MPDEPAALLKPPYIEFEGKRYPWTDEFSNREMLILTQVLASEGIDTEEGLPSWAIVIGKLYVGAKRIGEPLTIQQILDGEILTYVGEDEPAEGDAGPPVNGNAAAGSRKVKTPAAGGRSSSGTSSV